MSANKEIRILMLQEGLTIAKLVKLIVSKKGLKYTADGMAKKLRNNTLKFNEAEEGMKKCIFHFSVDKPVAVWYHNRRWISCWCSSAGRAADL